MPEPLTIYAITSLAVFLGGLFVGWMVTRNKIDITRSNLQTAIAVLVSLVWAASIVAEIIIPAYTVSMLVHGIMGAVVGYLFSEDGVTINIGSE